MDDELAFAGPGPADGQGGVGNVPCAVCGARTAMCCSACEAVFYCSPACQQRDWKEHWKVCGTQQQIPQQQIEKSPANSPGGRADSDDGMGFEVALPQSNFATAAAAQAAATSAARDRRLRLRVSAVLAARESRHQDALQHAAEAYEVAQRLGSLYVEGKSMADEGGVAELEGPALVELLIIVRAALALNDFGTGLGFLEMLCTTVDRLAGVGGNPAMLQPSEAATLLCSLSELCALYNHEERAEDYGHAYLGVTRLAHGEGSKEVGDAHAYLTGLFTRRKRYQEAILHAASTLKIRQRHAQYGAEKPVADAYWNLSVLQYQLGQHRAALDSLEAAREVHARVAGEGVATSNVDLALGQVWTILGESSRAMRSYRQAVRWRQRTLGFAHAETRRAASLLAAAEIEAHAEEEWKRDHEGEVDDMTGEIMARPRPRQRPAEGAGPPPPAYPGDQKALMADPSHKSAAPLPASATTTPAISATTTPAASPQADQGFALGPQDLTAAAAGFQAYDPNLLECLAGENVKALGMTSASLPPGQVLVKTVQDGSWADNAGLKPGMELLFINGQKVETMTAEFFKSQLRKLPVKITAARKPGPAPKKEAPGRPTESGKPAKPDKELDLEVIFLDVPSDVKSVGLLFTAVPPARVYIKQVDQGHWAASQGAEVGWELIALNDASIDSMRPDIFRQVMRARPLVLKFEGQITPKVKLDSSSGRAGLIKKLFSLVDLNNNGRLTRKEMFLVAREIGFPDDTDDAYQDEYESICKKVKTDPKTGITITHFEAIMNDSSGEYYADERTLKECAVELTRRAKS